MISVIIPLYNGEKYILRSLRSVLAQTYTEFEIVVVDDGSTDGGADLAASLNHPKVRVVKQRNQGVSAARNAGIQAARYDVVAFLDADDEWLPTHLEDINKLSITFPECGVFGTAYYIQRGNESRTLPHIYKCPKQACVLANYFEIASGTDFPMQTSAYAVRKETISAIGGFPVGIPSGEDILTLARLQTVCDFAYLPVPTSVYYLTADATKSTRPIVWNDPLDSLFEDVYRKAKHKAGSRLFLSAWYKRRMSGAILAHKYALGGRMFFKAFCIQPFQKKLYTSAGITLLASVTGMSLYDINKKLKRQKP